jgi:hypothetical protein
MTSEQEENVLLASLRTRRGPALIKWGLFSVLVLVTYAAFFFGLVLTIARIDGEFVGEVCVFITIDFIFVGFSAYREEHCSIASTFLGTRGLSSLFPHSDILGYLPNLQTFPYLRDTHSQKPTIAAQSTGYGDSSATNGKVPVPRYFRGDIHASIPESRRSSYRLERGFLRIPIVLYLVTDHS